MIDEILKEVTMLKNTKDATSKYVLICAHRLEAKWAQKFALNDIKEAKDFDVIRHNMQKQEHARMHNKGDKCKYCVMGHTPQQCPTYRQKCGECRKANHFKVVCRSSWRQLGNHWAKKAFDEVHQDDKTSLTK